MAASGGKPAVPFAKLDDAFCEGFRMPAAHGGAAHSGGRRPKASRGGNRDWGTCGGAAGSMGISAHRVGIWSEDSAIGWEDR
jgi:hypothetical protein